MIYFPQIVRMFDTMQSAKKQFQAPAGCWIVRTQQFFTQKCGGGSSFCQSWAASHMVRESFVVGENSRTISEEATPLAEKNFPTSFSWLEKIGCPPIGDKLKTQSVFEYRLAH